MFLISWPKISYYHNFPQYSRSFLPVTLFKYFSVCKVLSMLEDAATFDQATIFTLNLPQWVKRLPFDFSKGNGKGTTRGVSLCMRHKEWTRRCEVEQCHQRSPTRLVFMIIPSPENQMMVKMMGKGGHWPAIPDQLLQQDYRRGWSDSPECR